jgi:hypothetical protein
LKPGLSNRKIGAIGVYKTVEALFRNGYNVLIPLEDIAGYDLVAETKGRFIKIQVKTTSKPEPPYKTQYRFTMANGCEKKILYNHKNIDYVVCYATDIDKFWIHKIKNVRNITKKEYPHTGSDWRLFEKI